MSPRPFGLAPRRDPSRATARTEGGTVDPGSRSDGGGDPDGARPGGGGRVVNELFYKVPADLAVRRDISPSAKLVFAYVRQWQGTNEWCFRRIRELCEDLGMYNGMVRKAISDLESCGELIVDRTRSPHHYSIAKTEPGGSKTAPGDAETAPRIGGLPGSKTASRKVENRTAGGSKTAPLNRVEESSKRKACAKRKPKASDPEIPAELDTEAFRSSWSDWQAYRAETKKKLTPSTITRQLKKLAAMGPDAAVASIEQSIERGWQGLFEPKADGGGNGGIQPGKVVDGKGRWISGMWVYDAPAQRDLTAAEEKLLWGDRPE